MNVIEIEMRVKGKVLVIRCVTIVLLMDVQTDELLLEHTMMKRHRNGIVEMRQDVINVDTKVQIIMVIVVLMVNLWKMVCVPRRLLYLVVKQYQNIEFLFMWMKMFLIDRHLYVHH